MTPRVIALAIAAACCHVLSFGQTPTRPPSPTTSKPLTQTVLKPVYQPGRSYVVTLDSKIDGPQTGKVSVSYGLDIVPTSSPAAREWSFRVARVAMSVTADGETAAADSEKLPPREELFASKTPEGDVGQTVWGMKLIGGRVRLGEDGLVTERRGDAQILLDAIPKLSEVEAQVMADVGTLDMSTVVESVNRYLPGRAVSIGQTWHGKHKTYIAGKLLAETINCTLDSVAATSTGRVAVISIMGRVEGEDERMNRTFQGKARYSLDQPSDVTVELLEKVLGGTNDLTVTVRPKAEATTTPRPSSTGKSAGGS